MEKNVTTYGIVTTQFIIVFFRDFWLIRVFTHYNLASIDGVEAYKRGEA